MAWRVEQVEDTSPVFKGHDRGYDRNAALPFDRHPVGAGAAAVALGAHMACQLDGTAKQQQLFGQGGFARVRMRDDGEGAPAGDFLGDRQGHGVSLEMFCNDCLRRL